MHLVYGSLFYGLLDCSCGNPGFNQLAWKWCEAVTRALRWSASRGNGRITHAIIFTDLVSLPQKMKSGIGSPDWNVSMVDIHFQKLLYCPGHARVEWNHPADRLEGKATIAKACFSEDQKCWGAWETTCGHKAKDITPLIAWRREAWEEEALDDLLWKDERGPSSVRRTLELFQRQRWGNFWETGGANKLQAFPSA